MADVLNFIPRLRLEKLEGLLKGVGNYDDVENLIRLREAVSNDLKTVREEIEEIAEGYAAAMFKHQLDGIANDRLRGHIIASAIKGRYLTAQADTMEEELEVLDLLIKKQGKEVPEEKAEAEEEFEFSEEEFIKVLMALAGKETEEEA